jgi:hypothetical protein
MVHGAGCGETIETRRDGGKNLTPRPLSVYREGESRRYEMPCAYKWQADEQKRIRHASSLRALGGEEDEAAPGDGVIGKGERHDAIIVCADWRG